MPKTFQRNGQFWLLALQVATVNFFTGGFGPSQALLREDQGTSLTIAGLHGTAMGLASIIAGALNPYLVHKFGRNRASWLGLGLFAAGIVMFVYCPPVQLTLLATLLGGIGTSTVINNMVTGISHHYKEDAAKLREEAFQLFKDKIVAFRTELKVINEQFSVSVNN